MARADTLTWLSIDRYAAIMGINPLVINQVYSQFINNSLCNDVWFQMAWQRSNQVSREDLAQAIQDAERQIANYVGYNLLPDWIVDERQPTVRPARRELYNGPGLNIRGQAKSIAARKGYAVSGGIKARSLIQAAAAIVYSDSDGDTYKETATVTVNTTVAACEIRAFFPVSQIGASLAGSDKWEIRPITVTKAANVATIVFHREQVPLPDLWERLNAASIDGDVDANFLTTIDVYRVYNDPQQQVYFLWEQPDCAVCGGSGCTACEQSTQTGCLTVRDTRLGILAYNPATWNATDSAFDAAEYVECREPDRLRLWYYAGWTDDSLACPRTTLDPYWERTIAYYATALLDRQFCDCNNAEHFADYWREDLARNGAEVSYQNSPALIGSIFGTTRGGWYAWQRANQEGRRIA